jgi:hypothetical protein
MSGIFPPRLSVAAEDSASLTDILWRSQAELMELANSANHIQNLIGELVQCADRPLDLTLQQDLQSVDRLMQRLVGMARLFQALAAAVPNEYKLDQGWHAERKLPSLIHHLYKLTENNQAVSNASGECELF